MSITIKNPITFLLPGLLLSISAEACNYNSLYNAAMSDQVRGVQITLDHGHTLEEKGCMGETPLLAALATSSHGVSAFLLSRGADVHATFTIPAMRAARTRAGEPMGSTIMETRTALTEFMAGNNPPWLLKEVLLAGARFKTEGGKDAGVLQLLSYPVGNTGYKAYPDKYGSKVLWQPEDVQTALILLHGAGMPLDVLDGQGHSIIYATLDYALHAGKAMDPSQIMNLVEWVLQGLREPATMPGNPPKKNNISQQDSEGLVILWQGKKEKYNTTLQDGTTLWAGLEGKLEGAGINLGDGAKILGEDEMGGLKK